MFDADHPIQTIEEDRLNRALFSKYLARCLQDHLDTSSLVVGLYGGFGAGKTSMLNLVQDELAFASSNMFDEERPIIFKFNAWNYSGQHQLIYYFFRRLSSEIQQFEFLQNPGRLIYLLELYASYFTNRPPPKPLQMKRSFLKKLFSNKGPDVGFESGFDLIKVKNELNDLLQKQKHKIIVMIDNISLLYDFEIRQIFQLVKSIADFSNTIYLLSFDKKQILNQLRKIEGEHAEEFLEKIVQIPFEIPSILQQDLETIFNDRLNDLLEFAPVDMWNKAYWSDVYYNSLRYFFKNARDITRFVNTLYFSYPRVSHLVNPVDFFALTAIELFDPKIYFGIRNNKDLFTDLIDHTYIADSKEIKDDKLRCDEILLRSERIPRDTMINLLCYLFPRLRRLYHPGEIYFHSESKAREDWRICSDDLFDIYFRLSMQAGLLPKSEFETILKTAADEESFDHALARLNKDDRILQFLDQLDSDVIKHIPKKNIAIIVNSLLDDGDLFPQGKDDQLNMDTPTRIHRIIQGLLKRYENSDERFEILEQAILKSEKSIYISVHELREQAKEHEEKTDTFLPLEYRILLPDQLNLLHKLAANRIEKWAKTQRLIDHPKLIPLLYAWKEWGDESHCKQWIKKTTQTDKALVAFLVAVFDEAILEVMNQYQKNTAWEAYLADITAFISIEDIKQHAELLFEDNYFEKLREKEQLSLMLFLDLIRDNTSKIIPQTTV